MPTPTGKSTRAERQAQPLAREVAEQIAADKGVCIRPVSLRRTDITTGRTETVDVPCSSTLESRCPWKGEVRSVPVPAFLVGELRDLVGERSPDDLLFTAPRGGPVWLRNWRPRVFNRAVKDANLAGRGLTPHKLRHTAASLAIAASADVYVVQTMLGHRKPSITLDTYGHLWPDRLDEVADALGATRAEHLARLTDSKAA